MTYNHTEYMRKWRADNPLKAQKISARYYKSHRVERIAAVVAYRARPEIKKRHRLDPKRRAQQIARNLCARIEIPQRPIPERCECCGLPPSTKRGLHLDHCHLTGRFRGWICHQCNTGQTAATSLSGARLWLAYLERPWQQSKQEWAFPRRRQIIAVAA